MSSATITTTDVKLKEIVLAASLAPSGDNMQPWRFELAPGQLLVRRDPARDPSHYNVSGKADRFAIGCAIENASLRASELGLEAIVSPESSERDPHLVARLSFEETTRAPDALARAIPARATNRAAFAREDLPEELWRAIQARVGRESWKLAFVGRKRIASELAAPLALADRLLFLVDGYRKDLLRAIRWTKEDVLATRDGLPVATLELSWFEKVGLKCARSRTLARLFGARASEQRARAQLDATGAVVAIGIDPSSDQALVECGRLFERLWLACTLEGLAFQPLMGLPLMAARVALGGEGFDEARKRAVVDACARAARVFGFPSNERVGAIARIGFAPAPRERTIRREIEAVLA